MLADAVLEGDRLALARLLTQVENDTPAGRGSLDKLYSHTGNAHLIGITGSPGTGKSSLVSQIALAFRRPSAGETAKKVAVVAVDPSSPFTGGALLGDRVRMRELAGDPGVFIRSMASRGALGGLALKTAAVVQVLDAAGYESILIETVGAGQSEVDIARLAHTTLVVEAPGLGDDIQAIKAGILEIADILVINKADNAGVENTERALKMMLELAHPGHSLRKPIYSGHAVNHTSDGVQEHEPDRWVPLILRTIATQGEGVTAVVEAIQSHGNWLKRSGDWKFRENARVKSEFDALLRAALVAKWRKQTPCDLYENTLARLYKREISPYRAIVSLVYPDRESDEDDFLDVSLQYL